MRLRSVVLPIIAATSFFFFLQIFVRGFTQSFMLVSGGLLSRPWILLTHMFLHGGLSHLIFNMYGLLMFGTLLEQRIGPSRFLALYLSSGLAAGFVSSFFYDSALGASGAIMGILGALIILMPELKVLFLYFIPMPLWMAGIVWALMDTLGVIFPGSVGSIAHLVGMGSGLLYGLYLRRHKRRFTARFLGREHLTEADIDEYLRSGRI